MLISFSRAGVLAEEQNSGYDLNDSTNLILQEENTYEDEDIIELLKIYHGQATGLEDPTITLEDIIEFKSHYNNDFGLNPFQRLSFPGHYSHYFKTQTTWLTRSNGITLSVHYKPDAMFISTDNANVMAANAANAFDVLKNRHSTQTPWKNTASMSAQFHCHVLTVGKLKNPWNLEPWRTETNLIKTIAKGCNP